MIATGAVHASCVNIIVASVHRCTLLQPLIIVSVEWENSSLMPTQVATETIYCQGNYLCAEYEAMQ